MENTVKYNQQIITGWLTCRHIWKQCRSTWLWSWLLNWSISGLNYTKKLLYALIFNYLISSLKARRKITWRFLIGISYLEHQHFNNLAYLIVKPGFLKIFLIFLLRNNMGHWSYLSFSNIHPFPLSGFE